MIEHVFAIRKIAPQSIKGRIKLSDPGLLPGLIEVYWQFQDQQLKKQIETLMRLAGEPWISKLVEQGKPKEAPEVGKKTYRGQSILEEAQRPDQAEPKKPKQLRYRGQVITE